MKRCAIPLLLLAAGCGDSRFNGVWSASQGLMRSASTIELSWLDIPREKPLSSTDNAPVTRTMDYWTWGTKSTPSTADAAAAKAIADVLLDEKSYYRGPPKACLPMPGVMLRFVDGSRAVKILICFECRMLFVQGPEGSRDSDDFDPGAPALIAALQKAFPKDADLQKLK